jgi:hypothetical protein
MKDILEKLRADEFRSFEGASIQFRIPHTEALINDIVQASIDSDNISNITISILPGNQLRVFVTAMLNVLIKKVTVSREIAVQLSSKVEVEGHFKPFATITGIEGGLGKLEQLLLKTLSANISENLPPFIRFEDQVFSINVHRLLEEQEAGYLARYLDTLHLSTDAGRRIWVQSAVNIRT